MRALGCAVLVLACMRMAKAAEQTNLPLCGDWIRYRAEYKDFSHGYNPMTAAIKDGTPLGIFYPHDNVELQWFMGTFAEDHVFSVRSGGHSYEGLSASPCSLTIDTSNLVDIYMPERNWWEDSIRAVVGAGMRTDELAKQLAVKGLAAVGPTCLNVGYTGCTLGGCHGGLSAAYGLASDNIRSFSIVLANATMLNVSKTSHPDLFWALRGAGGGDFGVVTAMEVEAYLHWQVIIYEVVWELEEAPHSAVVRVMEEWQEWAQDDLYEKTSAFLKCDAAMRCVAKGVHAGHHDITSVRASVDRLAARFQGFLVTPSTAVELEPQINAANMFSECETERELGHKVKSLYYNEPIPGKVLEFAVDILSQGPELRNAAGSSIEFQRVGFDRDASVNPNTSSAADLWHNSLFLIELETSWEYEGIPSDLDSQKDHVDWIRELHVALSPGSHGAYRNFEDLDMGATYFTWQTWKHHPAASYYPDEAVLRLEGIKGSVDGEHVFRHALTSSFLPSELEEDRLVCRASQWPEQPQFTVAPDADLDMVMVGLYEEWGKLKMAEGQLDGIAPSLTHIVYSNGLWPVEGGWVNETDEQGLLIEQFVEDMKRANPDTKRLLHVGGPASNATAFSTTAGTQAARTRFALNMRFLCDRYDFDGVMIDWRYPQPYDRQNLTLMLEEVRFHLKPEQILTIQALVPKWAVSEIYQAAQIGNAVDYIFLITYDFDYLVDSQPLMWLTHFNSNLHSTNPALASVAGGVRNWVDAGAPRLKLVITSSTYGYSFDVTGEPPESAGRLDWKVRARATALTHMSQQPGIASYAEIHEALSTSWGTWMQEEVPELGGAAAWSDELGVWVGFESTLSVRQKAAWAKLQGLGGGMLTPLHMDAWLGGEEDSASNGRRRLMQDGTEAESLLEAFRDGLNVPVTLVDHTDPDAWKTTLYISLACGIPGLFLLCCINLQIRRWSDIRKMHDGLFRIATQSEMWTNKNLAGNEDEADLEHHDSVSVAHSHGPSYAGASAVHAGGSMVGGSVAGAVRRGMRRFSQVGLAAARRASGAGLSIGNGRRGSMTSVADSVMSMESVQSAFDGAMQKGAASQWDHHMMRQRAAVLSAEEAAMEKLNDKELSRKLALLKKCHPDAQSMGRIMPEHLGHENENDGYDAQRGVVRYSRLLRRDAAEWLDNCDTDYLSFYESKQRGLIKMMSVITMYSETPDLLERSLRGVAHGVHQMSTETGFLRCWDEAVCVIVCDGLSKIHEDTSEWLEKMGVYSPSLIEDAAKLDELLEGERPAIALHCFEGLMHFEDWNPLQIMLLIKQENAGKLDSQRWAFNGIGERLMPVMPERLRTAAQSDEHDEGSLDNLTFAELRAMDRYLVTVDAGTQPMPNSLRELLTPMRYDPKIAGTCGHMIPDKVIGNLLVMAQVFEYEHGHIIDKSMEAMFGFITVLPGAYSAYRYDSIRRDQWIKGRYRREGPLVDYFKPLMAATDSPAMLNMGLAEDRFLCFSLMSMANKDYCLWYCRRARAVTDVPDTLQNFLQQRRRWNNGAFFTRLFTMRHYAELFQGTGHSLTKRIGFLIQLMTMVFDTVFVWFAAALFYLWISFNINEIGNKTAANAMGPGFLVLYLLAVVAHYDRRVAEIKWVHRLIAWILALEIVFCISVFAYDQATDADFRLIFLVCLGFGLTFVCSLLQSKLIKIVLLFVPYILLYPTYAVLCQLYGFCHVHDVSWGTKGIESTSSQSQKDKDKETAVRVALSSFRFRILVAFIISNFLFGYTIGYFNQTTSILLPLLLVIVVFNTVRALGAIGFTVVTWLDDLFHFTALSSSNREFGSEYSELQAQVQQINIEDLRKHHKLYRAIRRRGQIMALRRQDDLRVTLKAPPAPPELNNIYEDVLSSTAGPTRTNSRPETPASLGGDMASMVSGEGRVGSAWESVLRSAPGEGEGFNDPDIARVGSRNSRKLQGPPGKSPKPPQIPEHAEDLDEDSAEDGYVHPRERYLVSQNTRRNSGYTAASGWTGVNSVYGAMSGYSKPDDDYSNASGFQPPIILPERAAEPANLTSQEVTTEELMGRINGNGGPRSGGAADVVFTRTSSSRSKSEKPPVNVIGELSYDGVSDTAGGDARPPSTDNQQVIPVDLSKADGMSEVAM